jgi:hypothetical protein
MAIAENVEPAYAESSGMASVHLSRRSECEGGTPIEEDEFTSPMH